MSDLPQAASLAGGMFDTPEVRAAIKAAIVKNVEPAEVWGDPAYDPEFGGWVAVVAVTPSGPLVRAGFRLKLASAKKES